MKYDLASIKAHSELVHSYVSEKTQATEAFATRKAEYKLDTEATKELKNLAKGYTVVVFSAEWCPDCKRNVPVLDLLSEAAGLEVRVFGHIMRDAKSSTRKWAVPPSPPEVEEFGVTKIPFIVVLDKNGDKVGEIIENPPPDKTLEQALLDILKK